MRDKHVFGNTTRRSFIAGAATVVATGFLTGCASEPKEQPVDTTPEPETVIKNSFCRGACTSECSYKVHIRDGQVVRVTAGEFPDMRYRGICSKGLTQPIRTYSSERLQYPMRRVGERGEGKFERISWDEAIAEICANWKSITDEYGPTAFATVSGAGNMGAMNGWTGPVTRLQGVTGASSLNFAVDQGYVLGAVATVGMDILVGGASFNLLDQAKTIVGWGSNPAVSNIQDLHWLIENRDKGIPYVVIDPVYSSCAALADWYVPINPSTDGALALGILNVILEEDREDKDFVRDYTNASYLVKDEDGVFLRMSDLGVKPTEGEPDPYTGEPTLVDPVVVWDEADGAAKPFEEAERPSLEGVPEVAGFKVKTSYMITKKAAAAYTLERTTEITGVPADSIKKLADIYANGPVATHSALGADHYLNGHYNYTCMCTMMIMTHNVGRPGAMMRRGVLFPLTLCNAVKASTPNDANGNSCQGPGPTYTNNSLTSIIETGKYGTQDAVLKGLFVYASGFLSVGTDRNKMLEGVKNLDFLVVCDVWHTESVNYADIILPGCGWFEAMDFYNTQNIHPYCMYQDALIEPLYESKSSFDICKLIAEGLGYGEFFDTEEAFLGDWLDTDLARQLGINIESMRENFAMHSWPTKDFQCGENGVFSTPDTRARIYREAPVTQGQQADAIVVDPNKERVVYWEPAAEADVNSPAREKFPFHAMNEHMRTRNHSQWFDVGQLKEYYPEPFARMNIEDAAELGIEEGDTIKIYNDRGYVVMKATITGSYPRKMIGIPRGHHEKEFIEGHFCSISRDDYNPAVTNQAFSDQAVAIEKL